MRVKLWLEGNLGRPVDLVMKKALRSWARPMVEAESIRVT